MGVLGSAFNPPHLGHLALARAAIAQLGLDEVVLVPTGVAPHKRIDEDPGAEVRAEMASVAAAAADGLRVSDLELRREGPSYSFETLERLRELHPRSELVWLMGADAALGLGAWKRPQRVAELARLGIAPRPGVDEGELERALDALGVELGGTGAVAIEMDELDVSSSEVRRRARAGEPIEEMVPQPVAALIAERGLYGG